MNKGIESMQLSGSAYYVLSFFVVVENEKYKALYDSNQTKVKTRLTPLKLDLDLC